MEKNSWEIWKIFWESGEAEIRTEFRKRNQPREWGGDKDGIWEKWGGGGNSYGIWENGPIAKSAPNPYTVRTTILVMYEIWALCLRIRMVKHKYT